MADYAPLNLPADGKLAHNITHFARAAPPAEKRAAEALLDGVTRDKSADAAWEDTRGAVANAKGLGWAQVHGFTFGTRLTNITRHLRTRDVDAALHAAGRRRRIGRAAPESGSVWLRLTRTGRAGFWGRARWFC